MASTSMESDGPEPDLLDEFFAEISNPEVQSTIPADVILPNDTEMTPKSPEENQGTISAQSPDGDLGNLGEPAVSRTQLEQNSSDQSPSSSVNPSLLATIPTEASAEAPLGLEIGKISATSETSETSTSLGDSVEEVATSPKATLPSSPNHDFSIEDLVSQDIDHMKPDVESVVFKRPMSPNRVVFPPFSEDSSPVLRPEEPQQPPAISVRGRKDARPTPYPLQRCFLSQQKRKKPETDSGHLISILKTVHSKEKLLIPESVLVDYLDEAGVNVVDGKVPRLLGVAAEHHSASIVQDVLQIYLNGQQDKKRQGKEREGGGGGGGGGSHRSEKKEKKGRLGRPTSAATKPVRRKGSNGKDRRKQGSFDDPDQIPVDISIDFDRGKNSALYENDDLPAGSELSSSAGLHDAMDVDGEALDRSEARSFVSKDERESERIAKKESKKDREKEVDKRNILTLDLLAPVLREQGYQIGFPPYFVN